LKSFALFAVVAALVAVSPISVSADVIDDEPTPGLEPARRPTPAPPPPPAKPAPPPMAKPAPPPPAPTVSDDWKRNHASIFLSSVSDHDFGTTEFNGGIEYEYQFVKYAGIGVQIEGATGVRNMVALVPIFIHPWKGLRFTVAGGAVLDEDNNSDGLLRVGVGYRFNITDSITFGPEYNADLKGGTDADHLFGVRLGYQF